MNDKCNSLIHQINGGLKEQIQWRSGDGRKPD